MTWPTGPGLAEVPGDGRLGVSFETTGPSPGRRDEHVVDVDEGELSFGALVRHRFRSGREVPTGGREPGDLGVCARAVDGIEHSSTPVKVMYLLEYPTCPRS